MGLFSGLFIGRESLVSHGTALAAIADNLANANTTGFKTERPEFQALLAQNMGSLYGGDLTAGNGVSMASITTIHDQGPLESTSRPLDFAVNGEGFFIVNDGTRDFYTRAGNFTLDKTGNLTMQSGEHVMGFTAASPTTPVALNTNIATSAAVPTTVVTMTGNLDASAASPVTPPANPASFTELGASSQFSTPISVVDTLGKRHDVALHFFHAGPGQWTAQAYVDETEVGGATAGVPRMIGSAQLSFGPDGRPAAGAAVQLPLNASWTGGAAATTASVDLTNFSGFATPSYVGAVTADGAAPGTLTGLSMDAATGALVAEMSNGSLVQIGTIALARFINPQGLEKIGDNKFALTDDAGAAAIGAPNTEGRGQVQSGMLENSNVDSASQFIDVIRFQRGYQAGSQVIKTFNDILNTTIQLA